MRFRHGSLDDPDNHSCITVAKDAVIALQHWYLAFLPREFAGESAIRIKRSVMPITHQDTIRLVVAVCERTYNLTPPVIIRSIYTEDEVLSDCEEIVSWFEENGIIETLEY